MCGMVALVLNNTWLVAAIVESIVPVPGMCLLKASKSSLPEQRNKGYGAEIVNLVKAELFNNQQAKAIYLHCDIDHRYYEKLGFCRLQGSDCMCISADPLVYERPLPAYF